MKTRLWDPSKVRAEGGEEEGAKTTQRQPLITQEEMQERTVFQKPNRG